eukprot:TRINITY_DN11912_c0_g1_i1.p1 TRINITY_DN11912_c0_g1~~TRINITY_DN11912_c0_g1_i1.p1  ORF type:complete len:475 (-),score=50.08 TRINITY_DN11912_c0_g1_i1:153-1577(-)
MSLFYEHLITRYDIYKYGDISFIGKLKELSTKSDIVKRSCKFKDFGVIVGSGTVEEYYLALPSPPIYLKLEHESVINFVNRVEHSITMGHYLLSTRITTAYRDITINKVNHPIKISPLELYSLIYSKDSLQTYILSPSLNGRRVRLFLGEFGVVLDVDKRLKYIYPFQIEGVSNDMVADAKMMETPDGKTIIVIDDILYGKIGNYTERLEGYNNIRIYYKEWIIKFTIYFVLYGKNTSTMEAIENVVSSQIKGCIIRIMTSDLEKISNIYEFVLYEYLTIRLLYKDGIFFYRHGNKTKRYKNNINIYNGYELQNNRIYNIHVVKGSLVDMSLELRPDTIKQIEKVIALSKGYNGMEDRDYILMNVPGMDKTYKKIVIEKLLIRMRTEGYKGTIVNKLSDIRLEGTTRKPVEDNDTMYIAKYDDRIVNRLSNVDTVLHLLIEHGEEHIIVKKETIGLDKIMIGNLTIEEDIVDLW